VTRASRSQQGMTLVIAMVMLVVITLFVVTMIRMSGTSATIVGNMQAQKSVDSEAQQAAEVALGNFAFFDDVIQNKNAWAGTLDKISYAVLWDKYRPSGASATPPAMLAGDIALYRPQCVHFETAPGYSALSAVAPQDTFWDIRVDASDAFTKATTETHQGVRIRLPAGNCP